MSHGWDDEAMKPMPRPVPPWPWWLAWGLFLSIALATAGATFLVARLLA
jgi:hypothetical protein